MPENDPPPNGTDVERLLNDGLRKVFGDNAEAYKAEVERHQDEARELIERSRRVTNELISTALDRLTFFGGDRAAFLGEAHTNTRAQREALDRELHEALKEARERFNRQVKALEVVPEEE